MIETNYTILLNAGTTSGAILTQRLLSDGNGNTLQYNIYTDANYTNIWGDGTSGTHTVTGTAILPVTTITAYGQMPAGQTPSSSGSVNYSDTVLGYQGKRI